jgi:hypothetical protein
MELLQVMITILIRLSCLLNLIIISSLSLFGAPDYFPIQMRTTELAESIDNEGDSLAYFFENKGQIKSMNGKVATSVLFSMNKPRVHIFLLQDGIAWQFSKSTGPSSDIETKLKKHLSIGDSLTHTYSVESQLETYRMDMKLIGASSNVIVTHEGKSPEHINYYNQNVLDVSGYQKITYHNIYAGIDWEICGFKNGIKHNFIVHPGADPNQIKMKFSNHETLFIDEEGRLVHGNRFGQFIEEKPLSLQHDKTINTSFSLAEDVLTFILGDYDSSSTLVIDPARIWSTYYGGSNDDRATGCISDHENNVFVVGTTWSNNAIADAGYQISSGGLLDGFIVKFNSEGIRQWSSYYGGSGYDEGLSCSAFEDGSVIMTGRTNSIENISHNGHQNDLGGEFDAFFVKFDSDGFRQWATYFGGSDNEYSQSCSSDNLGNIFICGYTYSNNSIGHNGYQNALGGQNDAFLAKFNSDGDLIWSTYYGGENNDVGWRCSTDPYGNVFMCGETKSVNGIASNGHQNVFGGDRDAFLAKFNADGIRLWATYFGGSDFDGGWDCSSDLSGNIFLTGNSSSSQGIAYNGYQNIYGGNEDAFVAKFTTNGPLIWATYFGGDGQDIGISCSSDVNGFIYVAGQTNSTASIYFNGFQDLYGGNDDAFLLRFNPAGNLIWSTYYGGSGHDEARYCSTDSQSHVYLVGETESTAGIASNGHQNIYGGGSRDGFIVKFFDESLPVSSGDDHEIVSNSSIALVNHEDGFLMIPVVDLGDVQIEIYDLNGRSIYEAQFTKGSSECVVPISNLSYGIYILRVSSTTGASVFKFVNQ